MPTRRSTVPLVIVTIGLVRGMLNGLCPAPAFPARRLRSRDFPTRYA